MKSVNICKIIPSRSTQRDLVPLNFVCERHYFPHAFRTFYSYSVNLVLEGNGVLHTASEEIPLRRGDLFFTFPEKQFYVENLGNLVYTYITFVGTRANALVDRLHLSPSHLLFREREQLILLWKTALAEINTSCADLMSEAVLLYTFADVCASESETEEEGNVSFILQIKCYVDEHFTDPHLSLYSVAEQFGYSSKYLSEHFKKTVKIGFSSYLTNLRIEHAKKLIHDGMRNVSEISRFCGFRDPLYFSKVFKRLVGSAPKACVIKELSLRSYKKKGG